MSIYNSKQVITLKQSILGLLLEQCLLQEEIEVQTGNNEQVFYSRILDSFPTWKQITSEKDRYTVEHYDPFSFLKQGKCLLIEPLVFDGKRVHVNKDDNFSIRFFTGHNSFEADIPLERLIDIDGKLVALQVGFPKQLKVVHSREHIRYKISPESKITLNVTVGTQCKFNTRIVELSAGGLSFTYPIKYDCKLRINNNVTINIDLFGEDVMVANAKICHFIKINREKNTKSDFSDVICGVDFVFSDNSQDMRIDALQFLIQRESVMKEKERLIQFNQNLESQVNQKTCELREKDLQLLNMDKIAGIAILGAGIAHEINTPLSFIKGSMSSIEKSMNKVTEAVKYWNDKPLPEELLSNYKEFLSMLNFDYLTSTLDKKFGRINKGIERIMSIVKNLKSFSRVDKGDVGMIDVNQSIRETLELLSTEELKDVDFVSELEEVPAFECLANEIHQCLLYTIQNAIYAVDNNGIVRIISSYNEDNKLIIIKIIDNGKGMSQDELRNAMNPFFTTKPVGTGTGLGLTLTERIMARHKGQINIASKEGIGTTVTLTLPVDNKIVG